MHGRLPSFAFFHLRHRPRFPEILELSQPFTGLMMISDQPLRDALSALPS